MISAFRDLTKREWILWIGSLAVVVVSNLLSGEVDVLTLIATCVGVTSLILVAKGNVWAQVLMILFCVLYGIISRRFHYWGEMITYLGMALPMSIWSTWTWFRNPAENGREVAIRRLKGRHWLWLMVSTAAVTALFYVILKKLDTPNLLFSTISITTSFLAAALMMLRTSWFSLVYASNDLVLIVLWVMASLENPVYVPVVANFVIFFLNDLYGFLSWKRREKRTARG